MYTTVNHRVTQIVMIPHAGGDRFALLLRDTRERYGVRQEDVAIALRVDRSLIAKWERGERKRPVEGEDVANLFALFPDVRPSVWITALGFHLDFEGIDDEEEVEILEAWRQASAPQRLAVRGALLLPPQRPATTPARSLRRLRARALQDRQGRQG